MTNPTASSAAAALPRTVVYGWLCDVVSVDTVAGTCSVNNGDGGVLDEVMYLGAAPKVGAQVVMFMFRSTSVVLGGSG